MPTELTPEQRMAAFASIAARHDIQPDFARRIRVLEKYDIVVVADDSGSMSLPSSSSRTVTDPYAPTVSRWQELQRTTELVMEFASVMDSDGIDLYFLNREGRKNVNNVDMIRECFRAPPSGTTPLGETLQRVFRERGSAEKKCIVFVATDGVPNGGIDWVASILATRPPHISVTILACTNERDVLMALQEIDDKVPGVDVVDDYENERRQVLACQGDEFHFSYGDYIVKALLGSVDPYMDTLDEKRKGVGCGCSVA